MTAHVRTASRDDYAALSAFLSGYLHEDFVIAHGTADGAVQAFVADASLEEHAALRADCQRFLAATKAWPWREVKAEVRRLGGAWTPRSRKALDAVFSSPDIKRPR